jgi:hypothetical protein
MLHTKLEKLFFWNEFNTVAKLQSTYMQKTHQYLFDDQLFCKSIHND